MLTLVEAIVELRKDDVLGEVERRAREGENPVEIINDCRDGMVIVGDRFATGELFLSELVLAGEIFTAAAAVLDPYVKTQTDAGPRKRSTVVMATRRVTSTISAKA